MPPPPHRRPRLRPFRGPPPALSLIVCTLLLFLGGAAASGAATPGGGARGVGRTRRLPRSSGPGRRGGSDFPESTSRRERAGRGWMAQLGGSSVLGDGLGVTGGARRGAGRAAAAPSAATGAATCSARSTRRGNVVEGLKNALASGLAAGCVKAALAPFDTIKTVQQQLYSSPAAAGAASRVSPSLAEAARGVYDRAGFGGFYAGLGAALVGSMPSVGLYFGVYSYCKRTITPLLLDRFGSGGGGGGGGSIGGGKRPSDATIRTVSIALSAAIGNTVASFSRVPGEVVKQKLQTGQYPSTAVALRSMFDRDGLRAFFPLGGVSSQMFRDVPYAIFTLLSYEYLRDHWVRRVEGERGGRSSPWRNMVAGGLAGGIGSFLTNPMDVVKTRLQTTDAGGGGGGGATGAAPAYPGGIWDCASSAWREEGPSAFLRGSVPRLMHKIPANAVFFVSYELFRRLLGVQEYAKKDSGGGSGGNGAQPRGKNV